MAKLAGDNLPRGMAYEWTDLTYQRILAGNTVVYVGPLCILLVFLVLAALYESFRLPLAIILIVPMCLLFAITGVWLKGSDNNIFTQIGLIVLVGLACKNAILIVEFAKRKQDEGLSPVEAAIEACRLRLRPILMTSIAFIAGVFPLVVARGAGAEMRQAMGVAVFSGMIGVTLFGLFLTPVFYVTLMKLGCEENARAGTKRPWPRFRRRGGGHRDTVACCSPSLPRRPAGSPSGRITSRRPIPSRRITRRLNSVPGRKAGRWTMCRRETGGKSSATPT